MTYFKGVVWILTWSVISYKQHKNSNSGIALAFMAEWKSDKTQDVGHSNKMWSQEIKYT